MKYDEILRNHATLNELYSLTHELIEIIQGKKADKLYAWLSKALVSTLTNIKNFAKGIYSDFYAIANALKYECSNGLLEGHVNRLKVIKRQMYGRANFDLIRKKVL